MIKRLLKYKNFLLGFSLFLMAVSAVVVLSFGFNLGIDFTSGSLWQLRVPSTSADELRGFFQSELGVEQLNIASDGEDLYTLTLREVSDSERQEITSRLTERFGEGTEALDFWSVSPTVSEELRAKAWWAVALVLIGISLYIAFAFRAVSKPVSSWKYGVITLFTLTHDVLIPAGLFALLGRFAGVTIDTNFMVALLVVMGFSVHDTIVVFDRIRENLIKLGDRFGLTEIVDKSIESTIARSVNTSLTLIFVLVAIFYWGPPSLEYFILAILVGTIAGTYSSIFVASPLLLLAARRSKKS